MILEGVMMEDGKSDFVKVILLWTCLAITIPPWNGQHGQL